MDEVERAAGAGVEAAKSVAGAVQTVAETAQSAAKATIEAVAEAVTGTPSAPPLPETRPELLAIHRQLRHRRDAAPLLSKERAELAGEIARVEVAIARVERAMDPPRL
jgi:hypothetical protein